MHTPPYSTVCEQVRLETEDPAMGGTTEYTFEEQDEAEEGERIIQPPECTKRSKRLIVDEEEEEEENDDRPERADDDKYADDATFRGLTYVEQMHKMMDAVLGNNSESFLFTDDELKVFSTFGQLDEDAKLMFIQLLNRDHRYIRVNKQKFNRVKDREAAFRALCSPKVGFVAERPPDGLDDLLGKEFLTLPELQTYAAGYLIRKTAGMKRSKLVEALKDHVRVKQKTQSTIRDFFQPIKGTNTSNSKREAEDELVGRIISDMGPVIRLVDSIRTVFHRLILVYNRTDRHALDNNGRRENPMANSILSNMQVSPRQFYGYTVNRFPLVWPTREELLEYERLLDIEAQISQLNLTSKPEDAISAFEMYEKCRVQWDDLMNLEPSEREHVTGIPWMNVFTPGWVLTRIMEQGASMLGNTPLPSTEKKDADDKSLAERRAIFEKEIELLTRLLEQKSFRSSARGKWWDRLALIYHHHFGITYKGRQTKDEKHFLEKAWSVCQCALEDKWVETGHRKSIETRLVRLKARLKKNSVALHFLNWLKGDCVRISANKISGKAVGQKCQYKLEDGRLIGVEELALEYYALDGWKGYHSETSILSTLFGLLFWDILFSEKVAGVFASEFQIRPLDLSTEFFYESRKDDIELRLTEIECGNEESLANLLTIVDLRERPKSTLCVGVNWKYERDDLVDIAQAIGGKALSKICGAFARTFWAYASGVPDLCLWKPKEKLVKIVEVKSDKDRFSQQQMVWMHLLSAIGLKVEEFHVEDDNLAPKRRRNV